jgi:putative endonuclease
MYGAFVYPPEAGRVASLSSYGGDTAYKMYYLYVLKSEVRDWHYIGMTTNLSERLRRHNRGGVRSSKSHRPFQMVYHEVFSSRALAREREVFLKKTARARKELFEKVSR